jgi:hypothetical protein
MSQLQLIRALLNVQDHRDGRQVKRRRIWISYYDVKRLGVGGIDDMVE